MRRGRGRGAVQSRHERSQERGSADPGEASGRRLPGGHPVSHLRPPEDRPWTGRRPRRSYPLGGGVRPADGEVARTVRWTEAALEDLSAAAEFIARDSRFYALALVREARVAARSLRAHAERG